MNKIDEFGSSLLKHAVFSHNRWAARLIEHLLVEVEVQTEKWGQQNLESCCEAVVEPGRDSRLRTLPIELVDQILEKMKCMIPKNMVSASLRILKNRHGHLPVMDGDYHISDDKHLMRRLQFEKNVEPLYRLKDKIAQWCRTRFRLNGLVT